MKVLVDRHHADLAESLLLLLEDRFGWEVYFPIGLEWAASGLWDYANGHEGVTRQFLDFHAGHEDHGDHWREVWPQHPEREHKLVTVAQFGAMQWDYTLASVTQHERLWHELAEAIGARSILQVGNVGQPVDWGLSHKVMAAANVAIPNGRGVVYHPEFSRSDYSFTPPTDPYHITSFMNCLPDAGLAYEDWQALQAALPEFTFHEYGILGRDGILGPSSTIAKTMQAAGWAFHDKPQGDGYGFVIHQWASVGRPLIGRRSFYAGKLAEPLWRYAVDLDEGIPQAAERIRAIAADPDLHYTLAADTRDLFTVDFDAEARVLYEYLA